MREQMLLFPENFSRLRRLRFIALHVRDTPIALLEVQYAGHQKLVRLDISKQMFIDPLPSPNKHTEKSRKRMASQIVQFFLRATADQQLLAAMQNFVRARSRFSEEQVNKCAGEMMQVLTKEFAGLFPA